MSSLVSVIGLAELTRKANELVVNAYRPWETGGELRYGNGVP